MLLGADYEHLQTTKSGTTVDENRLTTNATLGVGLPLRLLVRDRNRVDFRWTNGVYSTVYRNRLSIAHDVVAWGYRCTPYASAEVFYDGATRSWRQQRYSLGVQWPYKTLLALDTYYLWRICSMCSPAVVNVAGVTLDLYVRR